MPRQLLIVRHAKSAWDSNAASDFERPLAARGLRDAPRMGAWLKQEGVVPDLVVSSPAERAKQTAHIVCKLLGYKKKDIRWEPKIYGAGMEDLEEVLAAIPKKAQRVMLVGHNPGLEFLAIHLGGAPSPGVMFEGFIKTTTAVLFDMPDDWSGLTQGCAQRIFVKNPAELPE